MHASQVLFAGDVEPVALPVCDHYAGRESTIRKSLALQAELGPVFDVTADCEDGAEPGRELEHARMVGAIAASSENRHGRLGVRIHDPRHRAWHADLAEIIRAAGKHIAYVTIPKVEDVAGVERVIGAIDDIALQNNVRRIIPVHVLVETHGALREAQALAALPRVEALAFGLMDYASAFNGAVPPAAMQSPGQFEHPLLQRAKAEISVAAHAAGKVPVHNVCTDLTDPDAAGRDARQAARYGYARMLSLHPTQIRPIVEALTPEPAAVSTACRILLAAQAANWAPTRLDGRLHERSSYRYWWGVLRRARAAGAAIPPQAAAAFFE